jgi:hypothetical protein
MKDKKGSMPTKLPSHSEFGWFFAAVFSALAIYAYWKSFYEVALAALIIAALLATVVLIAPNLLGPLNRLWYALGRLLGKIVSPIVLGIIFYLLITPISLATRIFGRDELKMKKRSVDSYWLDRLPPGPSSDSFNNQY